MAVIATGDVAKALWPGVNSWFGLSYDKHPQEYKEIFDIYRSTQNFEEDVNHSGFGLAPEKGEGENIIYDDAKQRWLERYVHITYGTGFILTRESIEDNQYMELAEKRTRALSFSMNQTMEVVGANVLNNAFDSSAKTYADGLELCSTAHLLAKGGTFRNELATAADLSEASLEQACIDIMDMVDDAGLNIALTPRKLIIPTALCFEAERILKSSLQNDTANNAINALRNKGLFPDGIAVNHYLTDPDAWFIKTNCPDGLKMFIRRDAAISEDLDFDSENVKYKATMRFSVGASDVRGVFGTPGAA